VDGGVKVEHVKVLIEHGANVLVAGSAIFGAPDPAHVIARMKAAGS
jgi:pentose-5-phosphate-3-epimerase